MHDRRFLPFHVLTFAIFIFVSAMAFAVTLKPIYTEWLRLPLDISYLSANQSGKLIAFSDKFKDLYILDTESKKIFLVEKSINNPSPIWSPDGTRLFYRNIKRIAQNEFLTEIKVFEQDKLKAKTIVSKEGLTGFLSYNPYTQELMIPTTKGISKHKILLPNIMPPAWQKKVAKGPGSWAVSYKAIIWLSPDKDQAITIFSGKGPILSYSVSYKGDYIAFSDGENVYVSKGGQPPTVLDKGEDPRWHPYQDLLVFSRHTRKGDLVLAKELALWAPKENIKKILTDDSRTKKRNPVWKPKHNQIIFTAEKSTEMFLLSLIL